MSRKSYPKQFSALTGKQSLFQETAQRFHATGFARPTVLAGADFRFIVTEQLAGIDILPEAMIIEPTPRNTAPAILAAALTLHAQKAGTLMLVSPTDHVIHDAARFRAAIAAAVPAALAGHIVTFGITPDRAETGYGWLELHDLADMQGQPTPQRLKRFVEKPDQAKAEVMLSQGRYLWNAGLFLFTTDTILAAFNTHAPQMIGPATAALAEAQSDLGFVRLAAKPWSKLPDMSIDYAIMEKFENMAVMPYLGAWSDLGGWEAVWREANPDLRGVVTSGHATAIDCDRTLLRAEADGMQIVGIGLKDIIAIAMPDAVLIADKSRAQDVRLAVTALKKQGAPQAEDFPRDFRPWGWYEVLAAGGRFKVKRIVVHPGASLSLQSHHHRSEHWIVVEGTARVTINDDVRLISENQSVYIPLGAKHRLENPGKMNMVLIEVQTGSYLGEDDIARFDDAYARDQGAKG